MICITVERIMITLKWIDLILIGALLAMLLATAPWPGISAAA